METTHTPPPWDSWGLTIWQEFNGRKICYMAGMSLNPAENKANTNLVKAAPDLLAALELWQSTIEMYDVDDGICTIYAPSGTIDAMAAAVAKARGE